MAPNIRGEGAYNFPTFFFKIGFDQSWPSFSPVSPYFLVFYNLKPRFFGTKYLLGKLIGGGGGTTPYPLFLMVYQKDRKLLEDVGARSNIPCSVWCTKGVESLFFCSSTNMLYSTTKFRARAQTLCSSKI